MLQLYKQNNVLVTSGVQASAAVSNKITADNYV